MAVTKKMGDVHFTNMHRDRNRFKKQIDAVFRFQHIAANVDDFVNQLS